MLSFGGDVGTTSGAGTGVGLGLKVASSGIQLGMKATRSLKQVGRDQGLPGFNENKSSRNKVEKNVKMADEIYDRFAKLGSIGDDEVRRLEAKSLKMYIRGAGLSWKSWRSKAEKDPDEGYTMLLDALAERE